MHCINAGLLIPGRGSPIHNAAVVIDGSQFVWVGEQKSLPSKYESLTSISLPIIMPGLWDCHVHMMGMGINDMSIFDSSPALAGARAARDAEKTLFAGYTSVREVGGYGGTVSVGINEGYLVGPNIYSSMAVLSMTGGHGDQHQVPLPYLLDATKHGFFMELCDGVDECIKAVRLQLRKGARFIKTCATGGVFSLYDDPQHRQFSDAELKVMVEEAGRAKRIVAAHCHGKDGMIAALKAGVKTIEHGSYLDQEVVDLMKEKGAILIATRFILEVGIDMKDSIDPRNYKKLVETAHVHKAAYELAIKQGVKIALGTDIGISADNTPLSHGLNGREVNSAVECGMTPLQAIEAATATGPETLGIGFQAPLSGQIKAGYDADFIALEHNPLEDMKLLSKPENIKYVWKGGKLVKSPCYAHGVLRGNEKVEVEGKDEKEDGKQREDEEDDEEDVEEGWVGVRRRGLALRGFF